MRIGIALVPHGTLLCGATAGALREVSKHPEYHNPAVTVMVDTGWDDPDLEAVPPTQRLNLAGAPIRDMRENPHRYGPEYGMVNHEQLEAYLDLSSAGQLNPAPIYAALISNWSDLQAKLRQALLDLLNLQVDAIFVWVIASVSSTTGRATALETCMLANTLLRQEGVSNPIVNAVFVDSEGLAPSRPDVRAKIEASFY